MNVPPRPSRRRRRTTPVPEPQIEVERKYCDALAGGDECYTGVFCRKRIPVDGPRFCRQHTRACAKSYNIYKHASFRAEELQPTVLRISRKNKKDEFHCLEEIEEAIETTGQFICWAEQELDERVVHAQRFYGHVGSDPGHEKRIANIKDLISTARSVRFDLAMRKIDLEVNGRRREYGGELEQALRKCRSPSPEVQEMRVLSCCAVRVVLSDEESEDEYESEEFEEYEPEEFEESESGEPAELDDSALADTMDAETLLADERAKQEVVEMLRWYSRSRCCPISTQVTGSTRARDGIIEPLTLTMGDLDVLDPD